MGALRSKTFALFFSFFWLIAASHCVLGDLLAANSSTKQQTDSRSGCHGDKSEDKQPGNHHSKCKDKGCCGPAIIKGDSSHLSLAKSVSFQPILLPFPSYIEAVPYVTELRIGAFHCLSPPGKTISLIASLVQAPNAPPATLLS